MLRALLYLRLTSFANWLLSRVRRLRQPKYLFGALVGGTYFYFFFFRSFDAATAPLSPGAAAGALPADWLPLATALGALALLFFLACMWVIPTERASLGFSEAEIAFLFPAPISRRSLIHFRLLSAQFRALAGAAIMMLFSNRWTFLGGNAFTHAIGWWFVFSFLNLHLGGARFTLTRLADLGVGAWRRRLLAVAVIAVVVSATWARVPVSAGLTPDRDLHPGTLLSRLLLPLAETAPLSWILWPLRLVLGPFLAVDLHPFLLALAPAAAVLVLHYLWVVHTAVAFEDATVEHAEKRAARIAAWRAGGPRLTPPATKPRRAPFALASIGRPELAFLWKNLLSTWPYFSWRVFLVCAGAIAAAGAWLNTQPVLRPLLPDFGILLVAVAAYILVVGPQFARQDIRADLAHADILKTYPLAGWQIVLGQLLTPIAILSGILWLALLAGLVCALPAAGRIEWLTLPLAVTAALGLAIVVPFLAALQLLVPNAAALVLPGWFHATRGRGGGPEVIGQRMIFFFAQLATMLLALAPAVVLAAALIFLLQWFIGPAAAVALSTLAVLLVLTMEIATGVWLLGRRFERLDLSAELRA